MENNSNIEIEDRMFSNNSSTFKSDTEEHTPKLFSEENIQE